MSGTVKMAIEFERGERGKRIEQTFFFLFFFFFLDGDDGVAGLSMHDVVKRLSVSGAESLSLAMVDNSDATEGFCNPKFVVGMRACSCPEAAAL